MNEISIKTEAYLHDILGGLMASLGRAEILAEKLEPADPQAAAAFRKFAKELLEVWTRNYPIMPTNRQIYLALNRHKDGTQVQCAKGEKSYK